VPKSVQKLLSQVTDVQQSEINSLIGELTRFIQKRQREDGHSFVSRTRIQVARYRGEKVIVFRVVLANPLTSKENLQDILAEQCVLAQESEVLLPKLIGFVKKQSS
jgi:glutamate decarboxylase